MKSYWKPSLITVEKLVAVGQTAWAGVPEILHKYEKEENYKEEQIWWEGSEQFVNEICKYVSNNDHYAYVGFLCIKTENYAAHFF